MNSLAPSKYTGGFEVLEIPSDPYHRVDKPCQCANCETDKANPAFFEYFQHGKSSAKGTDNMTLILIFIISIVLFYIISTRSK